MKNLENREAKAAEQTPGPRTAFTIDTMLAIVKPHNDRIIAEHRVAEACKALELIVGHLGAAKIQRAPSDDAIIAEHIEDAHDIALDAWRRLRT